MIEESACLFYFLFYTIISWMSKSDILFRPCIRIEHDAQPVQIIYQTGTLSTCSYSMPLMAHYCSQQLSRPSG